MKYQTKENYEGKRYVYLSKRQAIYHSFVEKNDFEPKYWKRIDKFLVFEDGQTEAVFGNVTETIEHNDAEITREWFRKYTMKEVS